MTLRSGLKAVVIVCLTVAAAYVLGSQAGNLLAHKKQNDARFIRELQTRELLQHMGTIGVGQTLPDHTLQGLDRRFYRLSDLVQDHTLLVFFDYHCDNCLFELEQIKSAVRDSTQAEHVILISASNPLQLQELNETYAIPCRVLYDEDALYLNRLNLTTFPFGIQVDSALTIESIVAGSVMKDEIEQLWNDRK